MTHDDLGRRLGADDADQPHRVRRTMPPRGAPLHRRRRGCEIREAAASSTSQAAPPIAATRPRTGIMRRRRPGMVAMTKSHRARACQRRRARLRGLPRLHDDRHGRGLSRQPRGRQALLADIPLGKVADPAEVAETVRWLALDAPASATGSGDRRQRRQLCPLRPPTPRATAGRSCCPARAPRPRRWPPPPIPSPISTSRQCSTRSSPTSRSPKNWLLEAYTEAEPDAATIAAVRALVPSAASPGKPMIEKVVAQDWVTLSQAGLEPIRAGRFYVHTAAHSDDVPAQTPGDTVAFRIEAGRAFGTGHHATTTGCLAMLDRLKRQGARHRMIADVGTGTGLLAFAALALWPRAHALATDIDPVSIEVSFENAEANGVPLDRIGLAVAEGVDHPLYDALGSVRSRRRQHPGATADRARPQHRRDDGAGRHADPGGAAQRRRRPRSPPPIAASACAVRGHDRERRLVDPDAAQAAAASVATATDVPRRRPGPRASCAASATLGPGFRRGTGKASLLAPWETP